MNIDWNTKDPIYRQLHDRLVELILEGAFADGDALPSIREISSMHRINHITVAKAVQLLVDEGLVEKRRGMGMYVVAGAASRLAGNEQQKFLTEEWPQVCKKIDRLGLSAETLLQSLKQKEKK